jgi:hypothetical protein
MGAQASKLSNAYEQFWNRLGLSVNVRNHLITLVCAAPHYTRLSLELWVLAPSFAVRYSLS